MVTEEFRLINSGRLGEENGALGNQWKHKGQEGGGEMKLHRIGPRGWSSLQERSGRERYIPSKANAISGEDRPDTRTLEVATAGAHTSHLGTVRMDVGKNDGLGLKREPLGGTMRNEGESRGLHTSGRHNDDRSEPPDQTKQGTFGISDRKDREGDRRIQGIGHSRSPVIGKAGKAQG